MQTFHSNNYRILGYYSEGIPGIGRVWILEELSRLKFKNSDSTKLNSKLWNPRYILAKEFKLVDAGQVYFYKNNGTIEDNKHHLVNYSSLISEIV